MSYVSTPAPMPAQKPAGSHSGLKALTAIGAALAALLLILSVGLGLAARSSSESARQAQSDAQSLREKTKETETETATIRTKINEATSKKEAQQWCDSFTSANSSFSSLNTKVQEYVDLSATRREAIGQFCPEKKAFADAYSTEAKRDLIPIDFTCTASGSSAVVTGTAKIDAPTMTSLSSYDVTIEVYIVPGTSSAGYRPVDTQTITIPANGQGSFTSTTPLPSYSSPKCIVYATGMWPSGV